MGNPPFVGFANQSSTQKADILSIYIDEKGNSFKTAGKIDYVAAWYYKAAQYMRGTHIRTAFVSTNSITQGEQVSAVWKPLFDLFGITIDFAHRTFKWNSEASEKAAVHCVIVGFSIGHKSERIIYDGETKTSAKNISPYLVDAPTIFINKSKKPLCVVPEIRVGNFRYDGGNLIIADKDAFVELEPLSEKYIKRIFGSDDFINNKIRWCLWLVDVPFSEIRKMPKVMERIVACKAFREKSTDSGTRKLAETPFLFREQISPNHEYLVIPRTSSENRRYIPIGFADEGTVPTEDAQIILSATLYHFGILTSNVHMAWTRAVCGRLKSDYRYSKDIVYNNFPWPNVTDTQKAEIEKLAQGVLDARKQYPESTLADMYGETSMLFHTSLLTAHRELDRAVMKLYGFSVKDFSEADCVAALMAMYQNLSANIVIKG